MSQYKVLKKSFINGRLLYPDERVEYDGIAGNNLELVESKSASKPKKEHEDKQDNSQPSEGIDPELAALRDEYQQLFGQSPHHKAGADKLRSEIDAKRKELGV
ncbi:hypothetical protein QE177_08995 [Arsenophonus sp. aPb]|uniref:hypothetical protein n=1 Tax=Arsenophonus sp. aPb TaxID=3041619 RepID=UPI0024687412|nr:hypothetical protein [Arsenophonus sp. aPb]WGL97358.1 hypothetical protein QE177_08995 [Arsenophonus sp. aPb]